VPRRGARFIADHHVVPLTDPDGRTTHHVGIFSDVTDLIARTEELEELAATDALTGMLNRHGGNAVLHRVHQHAVDGGPTFSVVMCDLDNFKAINDTKGHAAGDRVLVALAGVLRRQVRASDVLVRTGGDEVLVVLPGATAAAARMLGERMRDAVAHERMPDADPVTISVGAGEWDGREEISQLLERVDRALYASKSGGRNRVEIAAATAGDEVGGGPAARRP
jgi:diguanylate cyclase (GGDEF)-like protein